MVLQKKKSMSTAVGGLKGKEFDSYPFPISYDNDYFISITNYTNKILKIYEN